MARVTATEVKEIMDNCNKSDSVIEVFINSASVLITKIFAEDTVLTDEELKEIERWFTAHMIASTIFRMTTDERLGEASVKYSGQFGMGLDSTSYGQMVKLLDRTGKITEIGMKRATFMAIKSFEN
jgi:hypothetical protein